MKKTGLLIICMSLLAVFAYAEDNVTIPEPANTPAAQADNQSNAGTEAFRITLDVDFTTVTMKQANDFLKVYPDSIGFGVAFSANLDIGINIASFLALGPKFGYIFSLPASYKYTAVDSFEVVMDATLIPLEIGAIIRFGIPFVEKTTVSISGYAGVGLANVVNNVDVRSGTDIASYVQRFDGLCFMSEANVRIEFAILKGVDVNIHGGYRMASVQSVKQSENVEYSFDGVSFTSVGTKGETMKNLSSADVEFDFSGLNIGVGISLGY